MNTLSERLKKAMKLRGMSQASLAEAAGMSQPSVWKITSGRSQTSKKILEIANALNVRPDWLAKGSGEMLNEGDPVFSNRENNDSKDEPLIPYTDIKVVRIWDDSGPTNSYTAVPDLVSASTARAYKLRYDSGYPEFPVGSLVVVDTNEQPGTRDFVLANIKGITSVYRYSLGAGGSLLDSDTRVEPIPLKDDVKMIGLIVFMSRTLMQ
ncbi:XRE family transcriptional regulator [Pantoea endophytica]|uniref:XRE family transcriptional regulator n=1 Tax=Pantoea endophytica TaxID=92488 RepID=UPI002413C261|nr:XRE family transcriptional regulator [Pantoea endophytica]